MQKLKTMICLLLLCGSVCSFSQVCYGADAMPAPAHEVVSTHFATFHTMLLDKITAPMERWLQTDYLAQMKQACLDGDMGAGYAAEEARNQKIDLLGLDDKPISFDELLELSKVITNEIGSVWYPIEWKIMVGEVVLNRVASPEYPDTIYDVIHQKGQYQNANTDYFAAMTPLSDCVDAAARLLSGERIIDDIRVVAQSGKARGVGTYAILKDTMSGAKVYLCYTNFPELYEDFEVNHGDCNDTKIYIYSPDNHDR